MNVRVLTLFPKLIEAALDHGVVGQAVRDGRLHLQTTQLRDFASGVHGAVDDRPFGGGDGMVMMPDLLAQAVKAITSGASSLGARRIYLSARGRRFDDAMARELAQEPEILFVCGRYGGVDQRAIEELALEEISIGDYVLSGGEFAALSMIDAIARHVPGTLGNAASAQDESFAAGLLEEPQFTRPREWRGYKAPAALVSGDHARIRTWKADLALITTAHMRPDLLDAWIEKLGATAATLRLQAALKRLTELTAEERVACGLRIGQGDPESVLGVTLAKINKGC